MAGLRTFWPVLALTLAGCTQGPPITPGRIVSNNPCIDAVLEQVAAPHQIGAISAFSHQPDSASASLGWARQFPGVSMDAESIIAARPSLVLTGNLASTGTTRALEKAGLRTMGFGVPASIDEALVQVAGISRAIGRDTAGNALNAKIIEATRAQAKNGRSAIIWQSGGFVPGSGTLQDEMLARAGFQNASARFGLGQWQQLPLETLVRNPPDVIFTSQSAAGDDGRALVLRQHMLARLGAKVKVIPFPDHLLLCGGPSIVEAMGRLKAGAS